MSELSVVLTHHSRRGQLLNTLSSFLDKYDYDVVIVDDSPEELELPEYPFDITILKVKNKTWINPCVNFNIGFEYALRQNPRVILIQNAECYHKGDVIGYALTNITDQNYLSFACYSLGSGEDIDIKNLNKRGATGNGDSAWYNHSRYRPEALHFCCAIMTNNLRKINGFDERFAMGLGYEDDFFIYQIRTLGLEVRMIDDPFVFHQYHYDVKAFNFDLELYNRTAFLCGQLKSEKKYRAVHFITKDF